jgi:membrane-associated protease RseP (regulator of RpoE activity)
MNRITGIALALVLSLPGAVVFAEEPAPIAAAPAPQDRPAANGARLGVAVEAVPPALAAQLPDSVPRGQGVLIGRVEPNSPAEAAGLKRYDLLLSYDDQKLFSPEQLSRLVAADQAGRSVTLQLARGGHLRTVKVALGRGAPQPKMPGPWRAQPFHSPHGAFPFMPQRRGTAMRGFEFESLKVERTEGDRYRAAIEYLAPDGDKRSHVFEGTRDELREQIDQSEDLPPAGRKHLLNALNLKGGWAHAAFHGTFRLRRANAQVARRWLDAVLTG